MEGAERVVAPLALQTVVFSGLTLIDVLTLPSLLLEPSWTRIVLSEILRVLTGVVTLSVDTDRTLGTGYILERNSASYLRTVVGLVQTLVDINASDEEEVVARRTVLVTTASLRRLANIGADSVVTNLVWRGAGVERLL